MIYYDLLFEFRFRPPSTSKRGAFFFAIKARADPIKIALKKKIDSASLATSGVPILG